MEGHTKLMVMFGGMPLKNTQVDAGGGGEHSAVTWLTRLKVAGTEFVNISPIRDDAGDFLAAEWIAPRPNTDTAILLGMAHTLVSEELHDQAFLDRYCTGFDRFLPYLMGEADGQPRTADWAAAISGMAAETIRDLARRMAAGRTMITMSWSLQRADHGEQPFWMAITLAAMLGQIGLPGGGVGFGYGSVSGIGNPREPVPSPSLSSGANRSGSSIPVARIADMLLHPGAPYQFNGRDLTYPDIRLIYWCGGNPFHHHQDLNRLVRAWRRPETVIVNEPWWTSTARYADIVLPATTTLERNDIGAGSRDRFFMAMEQAIPPVGEARNDFDIFTGLAERLGFRDELTEGRDEMEWMRHLYDVARQQAARKEVELPGFDEFWAQGYVEVPQPKTPFVMLGDFRADPKAAPLATPSGKIEIFSETIAGFGYDDCPPHPTWLEPVEWLGAATAARYPLHLMSNQPRTRLHGQLDNGRVSRASKINGREPVWIHPDDAAARGIADGQVVRMFNGRGECLAGAVVTDLVRPGVVQLATGAWYDPLDPARDDSLDKHGNANTLTIDKGTSKLGQGPIAHSCLVEIEPYAGELPAISVFTAPATV
jgi:biotin/methionine sulfoxide reductase